MKHYFQFLAAVAAMLTTVPSCTIKEDRGPCPFILSIDMSGINRLDKYAEEIKVDVTTLHGFQTEEHFSVDSVPALCEIPVAKDTFFVMTLHGSGTQIHKFPYRIIVEPGDEMEPISSGVDSLFCKGEEYKTKAHISKNYAELNFLFTDFFDTTAADYHLEVVSDVRGINMMDNSPIAGEFRCKKILQGKTLSIRVPRQARHTLRAVIYKNNEILSEYEIGKLLADKDYDWGLTNLRDITLPVGYNNTSSQFSIEGWEYLDAINEIL